jgi:hypothetical protein
LLELLFLDKLVIKFLTAVPLHRKPSKNILLNLSLVCAFKEKEGVSFTDAKHICQLLLA